MLCSACPIDISTGTDSHTNNYQQLLKNLGAMQDSLYDLKLQRKHFAHDWLASHQVNANQHHVEPNSDKQCFSKSLCNAANSVSKQALHSSINISQELWQNDHKSMATSVNMRMTTCLHKVVLHDVSDDAILIKVAPATLCAKWFLEANLHKAPHHCNGMHVFKTWYALFGRRCSYQI